MREKKTKIYLSNDEWALLIQCLNDFRNKQIQEKGYCPEVVDEVLYKTLNARTKRIKVA